MNNKIDKQEREYLIAEGKKFIYEEKFSEWEQKVQRSLEGRSNGWEIEASIIYMRILNEKGISKAIEIMEEDQRSETEKYVIRSILLDLVPFGPDFYEASSDGQISSSMKSFIKIIRENNQEYDKNKSKKIKQR